MKNVHVPTKILPSPLQSALTRMGFAKPTVQIQIRDEYAPSWATSPGKGMRGMLAAVNMRNGFAPPVQHGCWGGSNGFTTSAVDDGHDTFQIPPNYAILMGREGGGKPTHARVLMTAATLAQWVPQEQIPTAGDLPESQHKALECIRSYRPGYRAGAFDRHNLGAYGASNPFVAALASSGYLKVNRAGSVSVTVRGKNAPRLSGFYA
jgi:hypothetical protein